MIIKSLPTRGDQRARLHVIFKLNLSATNKAVMQRFAPFIGKYTKSIPTIERRKMAFQLENMFVIKSGDNSLEILLFKTPDKH